MLSANGERRRRFSHPVRFQLAHRRTAHGVLRAQHRPQSVLELTVRHKPVRLAKQRQRHERLGAPGWLATKLDFETFNGDLDREAHCLPSSIPVMGESGQSWPGCSVSKKGRSGPGG